jgi:predicted alpha/beta hydrolase family esterase
VGPRRVPVQVDDAPFVVIRAETGPQSETVALHLTDGSQEPLDTDTLVLGSRNVPYCRVKAAQFRARFSVAAWLQLAGHIVGDPGSGEPSLVLGVRRFPLRRAE